jgi:hypothetical protein
VSLLRAKADLYTVQFNNVLLSGKGKAGLLPTVKDFVSYTWSSFPIIEQSVYADITRSLLHCPIGVWVQGTSTNPDTLH